MIGTSVMKELKEYGQVKNNFRQEMLILIFCLKFANFTQVKILDDPRNKYILTFNNKIYLINLLNAFRYK